MRVLSNSQRCSGASTAVYRRFELVYFVHVSDRHQAEGYAHQFLRSSRVNPAKEFFEAPLMTVVPDMTEHGWDRDDWPGILEKVMASDILVITSPIWLGEKSSVCTHVVERLYAASHLLNEAGQYAYYGRVAGCLITGNEDGAKHCAMNILYSLQHLGYAIPPQADAAWLGEAGPGPSYLDKGSGGPANDFTNRNTTFMTWNLVHLARLLKDSGGIPAHGNQRSEWDAGCRFDFPNPDYR